MSQHKILETGAESAEVCGGIDRAHVVDVITGFQ